MTLWTADEDEILIRMRKQGYSYTKIGQKIGVSRNAAIGRGSRIGVEKKTRAPRTSRTYARVPDKKHRKDLSCNFAEKSHDHFPAVNDPTTVDGIVLEQLSSRTCKWPIGHPGDDDFRFCGKPPVGGRPYCERHQSIAYKPMQPRRHDDGRTSRE